MKLSAQLIVHYLRQKYKLTASAWLSAEAHLEYPILYPGKGPLTEGCICLCDSPNFILPSHQLSRVLIVLVCKQQKIHEQIYPNLCILQEDQPIHEVLAYLQQIYQIYNQWNQNLFQLMINNPTAQKLLDLTADVIPNPMTVIGLDFTVVATRDCYDDLRDSVFGSTDETFAIVDSLKHDPNYVEAISHTGYFLYPGNQVAPPSVCANISVAGKNTYRLLVLEGALPIDDTIGFLIEYLAGMISHILSTKAMADHVSYYPLHAIFQNILTNAGTDYVEISSQLSENGWLSSHSYQCILIQTGILDRKNLTLKSICSYVENFIPASCALEHQGNVVVYVNLDLCDLTQDVISQKLAGFIRDSLLQAGYSRRMLGHFNFQRQYVQAYISIQVGSRKHPTSWIHHFNTIALPYMLEQITEALPSYMICHEQLLQLKYEDERTGSQLYETLRCYLTHQQSATKTAAALYIHRSTLLYRLEKIQDQLKADLSDPDEQLYLMLSFKLMDQENR